MLVSVPLNTLLFASASVITALGCILSDTRFSSGKQWHNLRKARYYLALTLFILAAFSFLSYFVHCCGENPPLRSALILFIGALQALLFTMTLLIFIQPLYVRRRIIIPQMVAIVVVGTLLFLTLFYWETGFRLVFGVAVGVYVSQLGYYTMLFRRKYRLCLEQLEAYYDEDVDHRLRWVKTGFYTALAVGVMVIFVIFCREWAYKAFTVIYTAYYTYMVSRFLNYKSRDMKFVFPAVMKDGQGERKDSEIEMEWKPVSEECGKLLTEKELQLQQALVEWIGQKKFTQSDIGVEDTAQDLGTQASFLRHYFRTYMPCDFRTWRSELRIREALRILDEDPSVSISSVCDSVGFNDKGNFHRQFQKMTGTTPAGYKLRRSEERKSAPMNS